MLKEANGKLHQERDRARMERDRLKGLIEKLAEQKTEVRPCGLRDGPSTFFTAEYIESLWFVEGRLSNCLTLCMPTFRSCTSKSSCTSYIQIEPRTLTLVHIVHSKMFVYRV